MIGMEETRMNRCRDCSAPIAKPGRAVLCPACRAAAREKRRAGKRDKSQTRYRSARKHKAPGKRGVYRAKPPRPCLTEGCTNFPANNRALYCPACSRERRLLRQKQYREQQKADILDLPPSPHQPPMAPKLQPWAKSG
jgi:Zn finger protein HypA/HybF involved in hydrogenase expression